MIDENMKDEILRSIQMEGAASDENKEFNLVIASRKQGESLINIASGLPKIKLSAANKFSLILSQPSHLQALSPFQIRCCLCSKVISYPAWYYHERFNVNWFHYFICFDKASTNRVTAKCFRRF